MVRLAFHGVLQILDFLFHKFEHEIIGVPWAFKVGVTFWTWWSAEFHGGKHVQCNVGVTSSVSCRYSCATSPILRIMQIVFRRIIAITMYNTCTTNIPWLNVCPTSQNWGPQSSQRGLNASALGCLLAEVLRGAKTPWNDDAIVMIILIIL